MFLLIAVDNIGKRLQIPQSTTYMSGLSPLLSLIEYSGLLSAEQSQHCECYNRLNHQSNRAVLIMKFSEDYAVGTNVIRSFTETTIDVNNQTYKSSLIVGNHLLIDDWKISHIDEMNLQTWEDLLKHKAELIIIGTGKSLIFPHPSSYAPAIKAGIGIEFMDSVAACRTYNVLVSEDRSVLAAIIL